MFQIPHYGYWYSQSFLGCFTDFLLFTNSAIHLEYFLFIFFLICRSILLQIYNIITEGVVQRPPFNIDHGLLQVMSMSSLYSHFSSWGGDILCMYNYIGVKELCPCRLQCLISQQTCTFRWFKFLTTCVCSFTLVSNIAWFSFGNCYAQRKLGMWKMIFCFRNPSCNRIYSRLLNE